MPKLLLTLAAALLFAGCPGGEPKDATRDEPKQTQTTATMVTRPAAATEGGPINVDLLEYEIRMADTVAAGKQTFAIINHGKENHSFRIKGDGLDIGMTEPLARGDTGQITVVLEPGTYQITCPVDGHTGKGMTRTLTVR